MMNGRGISHIIIRVLAFPKYSFSVQPRKDAHEETVVGCIASDDANQHKQQFLHKNWNPTGSLRTTCGIS